MGNIHLKTAENRSRGTDRQDDNAGCTAEHGTHLWRYADISVDEGEEGKKSSRIFRSSVRFAGVISYNLNVNNFPE